MTKVHFTYKRLAQLIYISLLHTVAYIASISLGLWQDLWIRGLTLDLWIWGSIWEFIY